jgi:hypothetical protein
MYRLLADVGADPVDQFTAESQELSSEETWVCKATVCPFVVQSPDPDSQMGEVKPESKLVDV